MCIALVLLNKVEPPEGSPEGTEPTEEWEEVRIEEPGASEPGVTADAAAKKVRVCSRRDWLPM